MKLPFSQWGPFQAGLASAVLMFSSAAHAAPPAAGTVISNQATAAYTDSSGILQNVTSNTVETTVTEKYGFTLTQDNNKTVAPGGTVYFPHTLTNTGNASDSFALKLAELTGSGSNTLATCRVFADADGDGQPDTPSSPLASGDCSTLGGVTVNVGPVVASQGYKFVVAVQALPGATISDDETIKVSATSLGDTALPAVTNTDTLVISNAAVFEVVKRVDKTTAAPGSTLTYTLTVKNTGAAAGGTTLTDIVGTGATSSLTYVAGSARWSSTGSSALTDAAGTAEAGSPDGTGTGLDYGFSGTTLTAIFSAMPPNVTQTLTFQVTVNADAPAGSGTASNQAEFTCGAATACKSNVVETTISKLFGVTASGSATDATVGVDTTAGAPDAADTQTVASAAAGSTVVFDNYVWNRGNATDSFVMSVTANSFPSGSVVQLFQSDGVTPLSGSTTPPVPANADGVGTACVSPFVADNTNKACGYKVVVKVTLPVNATNAAYSLTQRATSSGDPTQFDATRDTLSAVTPASLVLSNDAAGTLNGVGAVLSTCTIGGSSSGCTPEGSLVGGKAVFPLWIAANVPGSYSLAASASNFAAGSLPAGWSVQFYAANGSTSCASFGNVVSSVTLSDAQANAVTNVHVACAEVTPPASGSAGTVEFYFQASNGVASSVKRDAVTMAGTSAITLQPSNTGQVSPGGSVLFSHVLTNSGNQALSCAMPFSGSNSVSGWTSVIYADKNNNGTLDSDELSPVTDATAYPATTLYTDGTAATAGTLAQGKSVRFFVKVFAPSGAAAGTTDVRGLTVTPACAGTSPQTVTDSSTVVTGDLRLYKTQALQASCSGAAGTFGVSRLSAKPGECVCYQVLAVNEGSAAVTSATLSDATPAFTKLSTAATCTAPAAVGTAGTVGASATLTCAAATVNAGQSFTMNFCVKVDQ